MKKNLHPLLIAIALLFVSFHLTAQSDSLIDLGRVKIRKDLTQSITIKGKDLEQIPFASISEIIAPWLEGALSRRTTLVYVVDGNLVNDADAWSIHDIEEITLVQNALVQVNGAVKQQQLVLVKTKRYSENNGLVIAGNTSLVKNTFPSQGDKIKSETNFYHQYQVAAWQNRRSISYGLSANFLRDVEPFSKGYGIDAKTPRHINNYRFNGWADITIADGHSITARMNYVHGGSGYEYTGSSQSFIENLYYRKKQNLFNPSIKLTNRIAPGLTNEIDVSYMSSRMPADFNSIRNYIGPNLPYNEMGSESRGINKLRNLLIRERIGYSKVVGNWLVEPALNFTYRSVKQQSKSDFVTWYDNFPGGAGSSSGYYKMETYVLTPAFSLAHKNSFNVVAGISASLTDDNKPVGNGIFPFASFSLDLLRISNSDSRNSLKLFGSYAASADFADWYYPQENLAPIANPTPYSPILMLYAEPYPESKEVRRSIRAGASFALPGDRFQINYSFENRKYPDWRIHEIPAGPNAVSYVISWPIQTYTSHRLGVLGRLIDKTYFQWLSGLNVTTFKFKSKESSLFPVPGFETVSNNDKMPWTGGWTNRLQINDFVLGLDVLYFLNERRSNFPNPVVSRFDSWVINNCYAGFKLKTANNKPLEIFVSARTLANSNEPFVEDLRRYYGAGFKLQF